MLHSSFFLASYRIYTMLDYQETAKVHVNAFLMKSIHLKMTIKNRAIPDISKNDHINKYQINPKITMDYIRKRLDALFTYTILI